MKHSIKSSVLLFVCVIAMLASGCAAPTPSPSPGTSATPEPATATAPPATSALPQSLDPFTLDDVTSLLGGYTVGQTVDFLSPSSVSWAYMGEATGEVLITLNCQGGTVTVKLYAPDDDESFRGSAQNQPLDVLTDAMLEEPVSLCGVLWEDASFVLNPLRSVQIGDSQEDVLRAYLNESIDEDTYYGIKALNPSAEESWVYRFIGGQRFDSDGTDSKQGQGIEYSWTNLESPDDWHTYYILRYYLEANLVTSIELTWYTDAE